MQEQRLAVASPSDGVFVLSEDDATLSSYRTGHDEPRVGDRRTVERFKGGDGRLRYDVTADRCLEPPRGRLWFPVVVAAVVLQRVMIGQTGSRLFDGCQTGPRTSAPTTVVVVVVVAVVVCQRGRRRRVLFATVVPGHAGDGRVPFGGQGGGRRARARLGGVHLITRPVASHGQRLPVVLRVLLLVVVQLLLLVVVVLML